MKIPEGFTPRGEGNEQPPETYDKKVAVIYGNPFVKTPYEIRANEAPWKVPDGPLRLIAWKILP